MVIKYWPQLTASRTDSGGSTAAVVIDGYMNTEAFLSNVFFSCSRSIRGMNIMRSARLNSLTMFFAFKSQNIESFSGGVTTINFNSSLVSLSLIAMFLKKAMGNLFSFTRPRYNNIGSLSTCVSDLDFNPSNTGG